MSANVAHARARHLHIIFLLLLLRRFRPLINVSKFCDNVENRLFHIGRCVRFTRTKANAAPRTTRKSIHFEFQIRLRVQQQQKRSKGSWEMVNVVLLWPVSSFVLAIASLLARTSKYAIQSVGFLIARNEKSHSVRLAQRMSPGMRSNWTLFVGDSCWTV